MLTEDDVITLVSGYNLRGEYDERLVHRIILKVLKVLIKYVLARTENLDALEPKEKT